MSHIYVGAICNIYVVLVRDVTCMVETDFLIMPLLFSFPLKLITCPSDQYMTAFSIMNLWLNQITKKSLSRNQSNLDRELVVSSILSALPVLNCR